MTFSINKPAINTIFSCLLAFSCSLPLPYPSYFLGVWVAVALATSWGHYGENLRQWRNDRLVIPVLLLLAIQLLSFVSALYAESPQLVMHSMFNAKVPGWLIPIVLLLARPRVSVPAVSRWFVYGAFFFVAISFVNVAHQLLTASNLTALYGNGISNVTEAFYKLMNRAYSGANISIALFLILCLWNKEETKRHHRIFFAASAVFFGLFLYVNISRCVLLSLLATLFITSLFSVKNKKMVGFVVAAAGLFVLLITVTPNRLRDSAVIMIQKVENGQLQDADPRFSIWPSVFAVAPHHFFYGYGENNCDSHLLEEYCRRQFWYGIGARLGPHNQYFSYYLELGAIGVLLLIALLFSMVKCAPYPRKTICLQLACFFAILFLTESSLSRAVGVYVFSVVIALVVCGAGQVSSGAVVQDEKTDRRLHYGAVVLMLASCLTFAYAVISQLKAPRIVARMLLKEGKRTSLQDGVPTYMMDGRDLMFLQPGQAFGYKMFLVSNSLRDTSVTVQCYVSPDFDGNAVCVYSNPFTADVNAVAPSEITTYNLTQKGTWQDLNLPLCAGRCFAFFFVARPGSTDLSPFNGHVLWRLK